MNGLLNAIAKLLLGWSKLIFTWIWSLFQSGGGGFASYARENWKLILIMVLLGGWLLDQSVWMFRFRPYRDWMKAFQRLKRGPRGIFTRDKTREADSYDEDARDGELYENAEDFSDDEYYDADYEDDVESFEEEELTATRQYGRQEYEEEFYDPPRTRRERSEPGYYNEKRERSEPDFHEERIEMNERRSVRSEPGQEIVRNSRGNLRYSDEEYDESDNGNYEDFDEGDWEEYDEEEPRPSFFGRLTGRVSGIFKRRNTRKEIDEADEGYTEYDDGYYDEYYDEQDVAQDDAEQTRVFNTLPHTKGPLRENWGRIEIGSEESIEDLDEKRRWLTAFSKPVKTREPETEEKEAAAIEEEPIEEALPLKTEIPIPELLEPEIYKQDPPKPELPKSESPKSKPEPPKPEPDSPVFKPEPEAQPVKAEPELAEVIKATQPEPPKLPPRKLPRQNKEAAKPNPYKNVSAASTSSSRVKSSTPILDSLLAENRAKKERMRDEQPMSFDAADPELKPVLDRQPGDDEETLRPSRFGPRDIDMPEVALDKSPDDDVETMRPKPSKK